MKNASVDSRKRVLFQTLGCKLNHYETLGLEAAFRRAGFTVVEEGPAGIVVVNSCAVTAEAVRQSLQTVRRARKRHPEARIFLAGCAVMAEAEKCRQLAGVEAGFGNAGKAELVEWVVRGVPEGETIPVLVELSGELPISSLRADSIRGRSRAELKIQDGCNSFCRYCIIPYLRGRCRSLPPEKVFAECEELAAAGFREIVLTGIHLGRYGDDLGDPAGEGFTRLLLELTQRFPELRFRLGSLQPHEITPAIIDLLLDPVSPVCEHLHLSLQSGSDRVLGAMGRPYRRAAIEKLFDRLAAGRGRLNLGTDLIVGFPAENEAAFRETRSLVESVALSYLHLFPYSPRRGTVAGSWPDRVPAGVKKERLKILSEIGRQKKKCFVDSNLNTILEVLVEKKMGPDKSLSEGGWFGHSRNYLPVLVEDGDVGDEAAGKAAEEVSEEITGKVVKARAVSWDGRKIAARRILG